MMSYLFFTICIIEEFFRKRVSLTCFIVALSGFRKNTHLMAPVYLPLVLTLNISEIKIGFWCLNEEQENGTCADFAVRYCCPKYKTGVMNCAKEGYKWSKWLNSDNPTGNGDFEYISTFTANNDLWA